MAYVVFFFFFFLSFMDRALLGEERLLAIFVSSTNDVQVSAWGGQLSMPLIARGSGQVCNFLHTNLSLQAITKFGSGGTGNSEDTRVKTETERHSNITPESV